MTFVRNAWYVAGWSESFGRELTPLTIMDEDIVIYRTEAGGAVALTDECPHKRLPLSKGFSASPIQIQTMPRASCNG